MFEMFGRNIRRADRRAHASFRVSVMVWRPCMACGWSMCSLACTRFQQRSHIIMLQQRKHLFMPICVPSPSPLHSSPSPSQPRPPPQPRPPAPCRFLTCMSHGVGPSWSNFPAGISPIGIVLYFNSTKEMFATVSETQFHGNHWMGIEKRGVISAIVWSI